MPSRHGKLLGEALAALAEAGRVSVPGAPDLCATCAFRAGSVPNMSAGTVKMAFDTVIGLDRDEFCCHHGMKDGRPTKVCVGAFLAQKAPFPLVKEMLARVHADLQTMAGKDEVQAEFDRWWDEIDPEHKLDVYELASAYARRHPRPAGIEVREIA